MENKNNENKNNGSLEYKNQDPFFIDYYDYRRKALNSKQKVLLGERQEFLLNISSFLDYSVDYIYNYEEKTEMIEELLKKYKSMENGEFRKKINILWKAISADHVKFEILPKPAILEDEEINKYWKDEEHKGIRELKKVTTDIFKFA